MTFCMPCSDLAVGELAALGAALSWTLTAILYTSVGKRIGALAMSLIRVAIACVLLTCYERATRGLWLPTDAGARAWLLMGTSGFFWFFLSDLCSFKAYLLIGPRLSLLIMSITPPMAAVLSWIYVGDQLAMWRWVAMGVTLGGVAWVLSEQPNGEDRPDAQRHWGRGILLALLAAVLQAIAFVLSKAGTGVCGAMAATLIAMLAALLGHIVLVTLWRRWPAIFAVAHQGQVLFVLICAAAIGPFIGVVLSMIALHHAPTGVVATIIATMPILILPFSVFLYREKISFRAVIGAVVAIAGVALLTVPC